MQRWSASRGFGNTRAVVGSTFLTESARHEAHGIRYVTQPRHGVEHQTHQEQQVTRSSLQERKEQ
eukprot:441313-Alexandrium_andersonii.AAC.1